MKKISVLLLLLLLCLSGCGQSKAVIINSVEELEGQRVGIMTGSRLLELCREFVEIEPVYYNSYPDQLLALEAGKISAFLVGEPIARDMLAAKEGFKYIALTEGEPNAFAVSLENTELLSHASAAILEMKEDGTLTRLDEKWFGPDEEKKQPEPIKPGSKGVLKFGTSTGAGKPMVYMKDGELAGFEVDTARLLAEKLGCDIVIEDMEFGALIAALSSGKVDMIGANMAVTEERKKSVAFLEPNYYDGIVAIVRDLG